MIKPSQYQLTVSVIRQFCALGLVTQAGFALATHVLSRMHGYNKSKCVATPDEFGFAVKDHEGELITGPLRFSSPGEYVEALQDLHLRCGIYNSWKEKDFSSVDFAVTHFSRNAEIHFNVDWSADTPIIFELNAYGPLALERVVMREYRSSLASSGVAFKEFGC